MVSASRAPERCEIGSRPREPEEAAGAVSGGWGAKRGDWLARVIFKRSRQRQLRGGDDVA